MIAVDEKYRILVEFQSLCMRKFFVNTLAHGQTNIAKMSSSMRTHSFSEISRLIVATLGQEKKPVGNRCQFFFEKRNTRN